MFEQNCSTDTFLQLVKQKNFSQKITLEDSNFEIEFRLRGTYRTLWRQKKPPLFFASSALLLLPPPKLFFRCYVKKLFKDKQQKQSKLREPKRKKRGGGERGKGALFMRESRMYQKREYSIRGLFCSPSERRTDGRTPWHYYKGCFIGQKRPYGGFEMRTKEESSYCYICLSELVKK